MLTPAERNRVRLIRDLLDHYERNQQPATVAIISREVEALARAAAEALEVRQQQAERSTAAALDRFRREHGTGEGF